jgi:hypothetical protein
MQAFLPSDRSSLSSDAVSEASQGGLRERRKKVASMASPVGTTGDGCGSSINGFNYLGIM